MSLIGNVALSDAPTLTPPQVRTAELMPLNRYPLYATLSFRMTARLIGQHHERNG